MRHAESEAQFLRYASIIGQALSVYPDAIPVKTIGLSVETYAARFRDAVKAKRKHGYKHPGIDEAQWAKHNESLTTHMGDGFVLLGTRDGIKRYLAKSVGEVLTADNKPEIALTNSDQQWLEPLCLLLSNRAFSPAPTFIVQFSLSESSQITWYESRYDVSFMPIPNRPSFYRLT